MAINDFNLVPQTMHDMYLHELLDEVRALRGELREFMDKDKPKAEGAATPPHEEGKPSLKPQPRPAIRVREPRS